jgi:hypothetical protein
MKYISPAVCSGIKEKPNIWKTPDFFHVDKACVVDSSDSFINP